MPGKTARKLLSKLRSVLWILGRIVAVLAICAVFAIPPVFVNSIYGYLPLVFFVIVIVLAFVYLQFLKHSLQVEELSAFSHCQRGQDMDFAVRLLNKSPLFFPKVEVRFFVSDLFGGEDSIQSSLVTLAPHEVYDFTLDIRFDHIGSYRAGLQNMVIYDFLGLFRATIPGTRSCVIEVTPCIYSVADLETKTEETLEAAERVLSASENSMDYATVREYEPGDPLKAIHWKLSARTEGYLTRLYESYSNPSIDIVLDMCVPQGTSNDCVMDYYDTLVETALSLKAWAASRGMESRLVYRSRTGENRSVSAYVDALTSLELLQDVPQAGRNRQLEAAAFDLLQSEARSMYTSNIALVTSRLDADMVQAAIATRGPKRQMLLFGVVPQGLDAQEKKECTSDLSVLKEFGISAYVLECARELGEGSNEL